MKKVIAAVVVMLSLSFIFATCGGGGGGTQTPPPPANKVTGVTVSPGTAVLVAGETKQFSATVSGTGTYATTVTWSVNNVAGGNATLGTISNTGSYQAPSSPTGTITITATSTVDTTKSGSATVTFSTVTDVTVAPSTATLAAGDTKQFSATVTGTGNYANTVTWSVNNVAGGNATVGTITSNGLYTTPNRTTGTVTVTATSTFDTTKSGNATVTFTAAVPAGPALAVDAGATTHAISPLIYGMNFVYEPKYYEKDQALVRSARVTVDRWGGNGTTRYNYKLDVSNIGADWYFETLPNSNTSYPEISDFNTQATTDKTNGTKTVATLPVIGFTANRVKGCSFPVSKYGAQQKTDPWWSDCGNGILADGKTQIPGGDSNGTSQAIVNENWATDWVTFLKGKFGTAANGGIAIYSLDNEPTWWDGNHRDVHPLPFTYDEVTNEGMKVAKAVKAVDSTAEVSGPVIDFWPAYFYSMKDIKTGWSSGPNWVYNGNPVDRLAHGDVPLLEYYLMKFKEAQDLDPNHKRFLDYLDLHTYFTANNGSFQPAGTPDQQLAIINSTRAFWDPTYIDPSNFSDPDDKTSNPKHIAPMIIRRMKDWIAKRYPGTKTAITEYNWGMQESISGAIAQADILGIFGREGLDMATLWGPPDPVTQKPGLLAFKMFRNYDGANSEFGDMGLTATSADQGKLAVYAAMRTKDGVLTVVVINKTFGDLKADLPLANFTAGGAAKVYQYSNADLNNIKQLSDITVPQPPSGSTTSTIQGVTFPAMSITVIAVPKG